MKTHIAKKRCRTFLLAIIMLLGAITQAHAILVSIDFQSIGNFTTSSLSVDDVTITGSGNLALSTAGPHGSGLGVIGGAPYPEADFWTEGNYNEYLEFDFKNIPVFHIEAIFNSRARYLPSEFEFLSEIEAYGIDGTYLGTMLDDGSGLISKLFGEQSITKFRITPDPGYLYGPMVELNYNDYSSVPLPSSILLLGSGFSCLTILRKRFRSET
jgi:hypothetical protein